MAIESEFLKNLLEAPGPSSFESKPATVWREQAIGYGADVSTDSYGNVLAHFNRGGRPRVMLAGHIDEIGLLITYVDNEGLIYFKGIGGWDPEQLVGQRVRVVGYAGELPGVIGKKPIHLMTPDDRKKISRIDDMWIDVGAKDGDEARSHVRPGDFAVIEQPFVELLNGRFASKAIDNRIGAYIVLEAARRAQGQTAEVIAVATVQEEIHGVGAAIATHALAPDVAIAVDVTHATDIPGIDKRQQGETPFGSGPELSVGSYIHRGVLALLRETAEQQGIGYTIGLAPRYTSTDADDIAKSRSGVPTAVVSIPNRYMHSPNELIDPEDLEHVIALLVAFIGRLDQNTELRQP
ncbi:MAG: M42 family metallopeptidase [Trueperaceae bacterium]|nr:MAG: M42 family metallopeptidase [Trueperaceae bacterium]